MNLGEFEMSKNNRKPIKVATDSSEIQYITDSDIEMDKRAKQAVKAAVSKAEICNKPVAKYDKIHKKAYLAYPDGRREYV